MSGAEVAGLLLGAVALVGPALDGYERCKQIIQDVSHHKESLARVERAFIVQRNLFNTECLLLLDHIIDADTMDRMKDDPTYKSEYTPERMNVLWRRTFGNEFNYTIRAIVDCLGYIGEQLGSKEFAQKNKKLLRGYSQRTRRFFDKINWAVSKKAALLALVDELRTLNHDLRACHETWEKRSKLGSGRKTPPVPVRSNPLLPGLELRDATTWLCERLNQSVRLPCHDPVKAISIGINNDALCEDPQLDLRLLVLTHENEGSNHFRVTVTSTSGSDPKKVHFTPPPSNGHTPRHTPIIRSHSDHCINCEIDRTSVNGSVIQTTGQSNYSNILFSPLPALDTYMSLERLVKNPQLRERFFDGITVSLKTALNIALLPLFFGQLIQAHHLELVRGSDIFLSPPSGIRRFSYPTDDREQSGMFLNLSFSKPNMRQYRAATRVRQFRGAEASEFGKRLFGLGILLIEVAFGKPLVDICRFYCLDKYFRSASDEQDVYVLECSARRLLDADLVSQRLGRDYQKIVHRCLYFGREDRYDDRKLQESYLLDMVGTLKQCLDFYVHGVRR